MKTPKKKTKKPDSDSTFQNYATYAGTLRAWLVAYGVGGPVLFLTNEKAAARVASSAYAKQIITLFLVGVALQVGLSFINKWAAWNIYAGEVEPDRNDLLTYKIWDWINGQSWIDFIVDVGSVGVFVWATYLVLRVFLG
jgi:hypothetical protein